MGFRFVEKNLFAVQKNYRNRQNRRMTPFWATKHMYQHATNTLLEPSKRRENQCVNIKIVGWYLQNLQNFWSHCWWIFVKSFEIVAIFKWGFINNNTTFWVKNGYDQETAKISILKFYNIIFFWFVLEPTNDPIIFQKDSRRFVQRNLSCSLSKLGNLSRPSLYILDNISWYNKARQIFKKYITMVPG